MTDTTAAPTPNTALAWDVYALIESHPDNVNMVVYSDITGPDGDWPVTLDKLRTPGSGVVACYAGWTVAHAGWELRHTTAYRDGETGQVVDVALRILGLDSLTGYQLFCLTMLDELEAVLTVVFGPRPAPVTR